MGLHYITLHPITFNSISRTRTTSVYNASFGYSNYRIFYILFSQIIIYFSYRYTMYYFACMGSSYY